MTKLREQVAEFHRVFGHPDNSRDRPTIPPDGRVRFRLRFIVEETLEMLEAAGCQKAWLIDADRILQQAINAPRKEVDLPKLADAFADIDYVVEGARLEFGIDGEPIADAVHKSNMAKAHYEKCAYRGGCASEKCGEWLRLGEFTHRIVNGRADSKTLKPEGWQPPDIAGELRKQGWVPPGEFPPQPIHEQLSIETRLRAYAESKGITAEDFLARLEAAR